jgi:hypothetical protein
MHACLKVRLVEKFDTFSLENDKTDVNHMHTANRRGLAVFYLHSRDTIHKILSGNASLRPKNVAVY